MTHDWQLDPMHSDRYRICYRCTICGVYWIRMRTEDGKRTAWTGYSPQDANINTPLPWRAAEPPCKQTEEPQ